MSIPNQEQPKPVLIEQSSKKLKLVRAAGIVILLLSVAFGVATSDEFGAGEGLGTVLTAIGFVTGLVVFVVGVVLTWWHHG
ncbi:hypothetical protein SH501x_000920 [Pirellulaceae bacterium SH501]